MYNKVIRYNDLKEKGEINMTLGCSSFSWETKDQKHLLGRTYDQFGKLNGNRIAVVPRNYKMKTEINESSNSIITVKYAFMGMAVLGLHTPVMVDGINEKGLMGALLNYPGYAVYDTQKDKNHCQIHPGFLIGCLLGQCATIKEAVKYLSFINLTNEKIFDQEMTVHYILSDSTGETVIVEPDTEGIHIHRNTIGVMTNSPDYLWQKTNLRNYVPVTNLHTKPKKIINEVFSCFGNGTGGSFGLPGDYSSPSRFVRLSIMKNFAVKGKNEIDGVTGMFRCFAPVTIPEGILKAVEDNEDYHQTLCTCVMCSESLTYYFSTASNRRICAICLTNELNNKDIKYFDLQEKQDISYLN